MGAATGTLVIVAAGAYLNRRTNNYIAIFFNSARPTPDLSTTQVESSTETAAQIAPEKASSSITKKETITQKPLDDLFCKCKVAVFQIIDSHDYWNTSVFLNAKTGKTFVSEAAEKGAAAPTSK